MLINLGKIEGDVIVELPEGKDTAYITGVVIGNVALDIRGADAGQFFCIELKQGNGGGHQVTFSDGMSVLDPAGYLAQAFENTTEGAKSIGLWSCNGAQLVALGYNAS